MDLRRSMLMTTCLLAATRPALAQDELAREARLEPILRIALARNPALDEGRLRADAAAARARGSARLPPPELKSEVWSVPLDRPWAFGSADTIMLGIRQAVPAPGLRAARERVGSEEAATLRESARTTALDVTVEVRRAFAEYARTDQELVLHREHVALTSRLLELARLNYQGGRGTQQDVLRLGLELSRLHADLARIEQERRSSRARLNALMGRAPSAPLGSPPPAIPPAASDDGAIEVANRPELAAGARAVQRSEAAVELVKREASWPSLMLGLDYMYMPMGEHRHGYGAMVAVSLPWLSGRRDDLQAAEHSLLADRRALEATRITLQYEVEEATARVEGARRGFEVIDRDLLPQARRSLEATQAAFGTGHGDALGLLDALRSYLQVQVERVRAIARMEVARADLDRAAGRQVTP